MTIYFNDESLQDIEVFKEHATAEPSLIGHLRRWHAGEKYHFFAKEFVLSEETLRAIADRIATLNKEIGA
jgi:hypothetical protein